MPPPAHTPDAQRLKSPPPPPPPLPHHITSLVDSLLRRLADLEQVQIPQLAGCKGPLSFHEELAGGVRGELAGCKRDLEELKLEVDDLEKARDRLAAAEHVKAVHQRLDSCTRLYRQAVVTSKRQIDAFSHLSARDELFSTQSGQGGGAGGRDSPSPYGSARGGISRARSPAAGQTSDDALMSATSDVTEGLRRTLQLMQSEVDRSLVSNELLQSQTQTMQLTTDEYSTLSSLLSSSKNLITSLERADVLDRLLLFFAFSFFAAVCAHIFKKRVIDKGVRVAGALGSIAARGGSLVGAVGGLGKHVEQAREIGHHGAREVVRSEIYEEVTRAAATATAVVGAIKAGVTKIAGKGRDVEAVEREPAAAPYEDLVPRKEEEEARSAAPVVERSEPVSQGEEEEEDDDEQAFEDASDSPLFDTPSSPTGEDEADVSSTAVPIDSVSNAPPPAASSADPLPSASTTTAITSIASAYSTPSSTPPFPDPPSAEPAAPPSAASPYVQLPLDDVPAPEEGQGIFQPGDADLHRVVPPPLPTGADPVEDLHPTMPPVAGHGLPEELEELEDAQAVEAEAEEEVPASGLADEAGRVELRQQHPPIPSTADLPVFEELAEETPAVLPDEKPDLEEIVEHEEQQEVEEPVTQVAEPEELSSAVEDEDDEKVFQSVKSLRPSRPDLDEQLGDINQIVEDNRVAPTSPSTSLEAVDIPTPVDNVSATAANSLPESTTMPTPPSADDNSPALSDDDALPTNQQEVHIAVDDPTLLDAYASTPPGIVDVAAKAEEPRKVAGPEGTTVPLSASSGAGGNAPPPIDVREDGTVPAGTEVEAEEEVVERETTLPIDLDAEQTVWAESDEAAREAEEVKHHGTEEEREALELDVEAPQAVVGAEQPLSPPLAEGSTEAEQEEENDLLEEMMERQLGSGGGHGAVVGGLMRNASEVEEGPSSVEVDEEESAAQEEKAVVEEEESLDPEAVEEGVQEEDEQRASEVEEVERVTEPEEEAEALEATGSEPDDDEAPVMEDASLPAEDSVVQEDEFPTIAVATPQPTATPSPSTEVSPPPFTASAYESTTTPLDFNPSAPPPAAEAEAEPTVSVVSSSSPPPTPVETAYEPQTTSEPEYPPPIISDELEEPPHASSSTPSLEEETAPAPVPTSSTEIVEEESYDDVASAIAGQAAPFIDELVEEEEEPISAFPIPSADETSSTEAVNDESAATSSRPVPAAHAAGEAADLPPADADEEVLGSTDADIPNSDALYPEASVEETPSDLEADFPSHGLSDEAEGSDVAVFSSAADEAVASHLGEDDEPPAPGHQDEALLRAEERLQELEDEGGEAEEFNVGAGSQASADEGESEEEEVGQEQVQRDEL
ncbi:hypothetical protein JCM11251_007493 [Rhodosporidiobolus azoricus]